MRMLDVIELGENRYQPDPAYNYRDDRRYRLDQQVLSFLVGVIALALPVALIFGWRTGVLGIAPATCFHDSISHFYYTQFLGDIFVAALTFIGAFLVAYRGESWKESRLATGAGIGAFGVALFPTTGRGCEEALFPGRALVDLGVSSKTEPATIEAAATLGQFFELFPYVNVVHYACAAVLFSFIAFYTLFVFTRVVKDEHCAGNEMKASKALRNLIYRISGGLIVLSIVALLGKLVIGHWSWWTENNLTFWFETLALWAFGLSWMVKGRFYRLLLPNLLLDDRDKVPTPSALSSEPV